MEKTRNGSRCADEERCNGPGIRLAAAPDRVGDGALVREGVLAADVYIFLSMYTRASRRKENIPLRQAHRLRRSQ